MSAQPQTSADDTQGPYAGAGDDGRYRTADVPVEGGSLRVGIWDPASGGEPALTVLAIHGITASHMAWVAFAEAMPEAQIIAPDLRGRARSNALPGPFGMRTHAQDVAAVLRALAGPEPVVVVGHSMGAFVTMALAGKHPELVASMVLVDGGLPLELPEGISGEDVMNSVLGPAAARLSMTFESRAAYRDFWRKHPAFQDWNEAIAAYVDYDLEGEEPVLRPSSNIEAIAADAGDLSIGAVVEQVLASPPGPISFLRAPRGLLNEERALYTPEYLQQWIASAPAIRAEDVEDVNHYTVIMSDAGVQRVAAAARWS